jgi:predicted MFS family arabinose efflux permease
MGVVAIALLSVLFQVVAFFGAALFHTNQVTYRQLVTPKALLGRMNASMKWVMLIGMPLGAVVGSIIAERFGLHAALYASAIGIVVGPVPLLFSGIASVRRQPEHTDS